MNRISDVTDRMTKIKALFKCVILRYIDSTITGARLLQNEVQEVSTLNVLQDFLQDMNFRLTKCFILKFNERLFQWKGFFGILFY